MVRRIIEPTLDAMQTVPTFAFLVPIMLLFGFGPVCQWRSKKGPPRRCNTSERLN